MIVALGEIKSNPTPETIGKIPEGSHNRHCELLHN